MNRRAFLVTGAGLAATALAGCTAEGGEQTDDYDVGMTTSDFRPAGLTVSAGTTVVWKNTSSHAHTVTAYEEQIPEDAAFFASGDFDSQSAAERGWRKGSNGGLFQGDTYRHTFEVPGDYTYFCIPHETAGMAATLTVTESTASE